MIMLPAADFCQELKKGAPEFLLPDYDPTRNPPFRPSTISHILFRGFLTVNIRDVFETKRGLK
jgi:hypothetical protein